MTFNIPVFLFSLVILTGILALLNFFPHVKEKKWLRVTAEQSRAFFPILLVVFLLRSFAGEAFRIPSGSLKPTLLVGDLVLVNKYIYGLHSPFSNTTWIKNKNPKVGDIIVLHWPPDKSNTIYYIKRVVGAPGDRVQYNNKVLTINGKIAKQTFVDFATDSDPQGNLHTVKKMQENLNGVEHAIYIRPNLPSRHFSITVPPHMYFVMGDNRDDSADSRYWGFVPENNVVGKAFAVLLSWNTQSKDWGSFIRWGRTFSSVA